MTDFDEIVTKYYSAIIEFAKGNHHLMENIFSHTDEVTLANPFGSISHGWNEVNKTLELNAFYIKEGTNTIKNIVKIETPELAFLTHIERIKANLAGKEGVEFSLRVTSVFRKENGVWKLVLRHADPLANLQPPEFIFQLR